MVPGAGQPERQPEALRPGPADDRDVHGVEGYRVASSAVAGTVNHVLELLVGLACIGLAVPAWQRGGALRVVAAVFALGGLAAVVHAAIAFVQ